MNTPKDRQQWIYDLLIREPTLSFTDGFTKYLLNFTNSKGKALSKVTFTKDWKQAQALLKEYQRTINDEKLKESIKQEKKAVKRNILSKHDAMEILTTIAKNAFGKENDRIKAIAELSKFEGWYEPKKIDITTDFKLEPLTDEEFEVLKNARENNKKRT